MDLLQLRYFCHAASTQNFSQTARAFLVPTSNISQCIKRLESELGVALFIRSANRLQLSPQGELLYKGVLKTLDTLDATLFAVKSGANKESIRIAICLHRQTVMRVLEAFQAKYPGVQIIHERPATPAAGVSCEGYDLIVTDDSIDDPAFEKKHVFRSKSVLIAPKGLLPKDEITPELLEQQTFISLPPGSYMYRNTQRFFQKMNISPSLLHEEKYSIHFVPRCVEQRLGVAFAPLTTRWAEHMIEFLDIYDIGDVYQDVYIYYRKASTSPYIISLYDSLLNAYKERSTANSTTYPGNDR